MAVLKVFLEVCMNYDEVNTGKLNDLNGRRGLSILTGEWGLADLTGEIGLAKLTGEYQLKELTGEGWLPNASRSQDDDYN
jgi:hypothetical protein